MKSRAMDLSTLAALSLAISLSVEPLEAQGTWTPTANLFAARSGHTATLLPSGKVLVVGGVDSGNRAIASAEIFDPAYGRWLPAGSLLQGRSAHTASLLLDGRVLVAGGLGDLGELASAELFDPDTGQWQATNPMASSRKNQTATSLPNGKVLLVGGEASGLALSACEIYDPGSGTWSPTGSLANARTGHTATLLGSGKVLVAAGSDIFTAFKSLEQFDPATGLWVGAGSLHSVHWKHSATLLPSGKVLIWGGVGPTSTSSVVETYDPATEMSFVSGEPAQRRSSHTAAVLASGEILIAGGTAPSGGALLASTEIYSPTTGTWTTSAPLAESRSAFTSTTLPSGRVLICGGLRLAALASAEIYDLASYSWDSTGVNLRNRYFHTATLLPNGSVLIANGQTGSVGGPTAELYDPVSGLTSAAAPPRDFRAGHSATLLPSGRVLFVGEPTNAPPSAEVYDWETNSWTPVAQPPENRQLHSATLIPSGEVLIAGGFGVAPNSFRKSLALYDEVSDTWRAGASLIQGRASHTATMLPSGKILIVGGTDGSTALATVELYDPEDNSIHSSTQKDLSFCVPGVAPQPEAPCPLSEAREGHAAVLLQSGRVLVLGGSQVNGSTLSSAEIYDPASGRWSSAGSLVVARVWPRATLLSDGAVLVSGGYSYDLDFTVEQAEIYDEGSGSWEATQNISFNRYLHQVVLLATGEVFLSGGRRCSSSCGSSTYSVSGRYKPRDWPAARRPVLGWVPTTIRYGQALSVQGASFGGDSEGSTSATASSAINRPLAMLRAVEGDTQAWLDLEPLPVFCPNTSVPARPFGFCSDQAATLTIRRIPPVFNPGWHLLTVFVGGIPSESKLVNLECSLAITQQPEDQTVAIGAIATFGAVESLGGRSFQWQQCTGDAAACSQGGSGWVNIPGAIASTYTTPPVAPAMAGTRYRAVVGSGCMSQASDIATLHVGDEAEPQASVVSPSGGEYWLLSSSSHSNSEIVTWSMSDNIRICRTEVRLLSSQDGGISYGPISQNGGLLFEEGPGGACPFGEQPETTSLEYLVPLSPPSGLHGSLYKIEVRVTDHTGLSSTALSPNPFYMVQANTDSVRTLILSNIGRMQQLMGFSGSVAIGLRTKLEELADHPRVQGRVVDLGLVPGIANLYDAWDNDVANPSRANDVLFSPQGIQDYLLSELLPVYSGLQYLVVVGDDRIVPFARIEDRTGLTESNYTSGGDLSPTGSTVGRAPERVNNFETVGLTI